MKANDINQHRTHDRAHDIVVYGATGFVGKLVARHLAGHAPDGARIALAGRDRAKLEALRAELPDAAGDWPLIVADATDAPALRGLAESTRVVLTLVGPYAKYGRELVAACAEAGTDYVDLTGEVLFAHDSMVAHHDRARETGARIVHSCGFDSIPSDVAVKTLHDAAGIEIADATLIVTHLRGGLSGGTIDSLRHQLAEMREDPARARIAGAAFSLNPGLYGPGGDRANDTPLIPRGAVIPAETGWLAPFFMAPYNTRVVRRTAHFLGYGPDFRYREAMNVGRGARSWLRARLVKAGMAGLIGAMMFPPTARFVDRKLPKPGEGPSESERARGRFTFDLHADDRTGGRWTSRVSLEQDPGYDGTAMMISAAAMALAFDRDRLPDRHGVLTPMSGIGEPLVDRLREGGMSITARPAR
ncbi:MAG TPA: enoyl-ACP reductase [Actinomycetales bacterium]|nr:enoyl-ACP reductase [Actinomycetales bacterium]